MSSKAYPISLSLFTYLPYSHYLSFNLFHFLLTNTGLLVILQQLLSLYNIPSLPPSIFFSFSHYFILSLSLPLSFSFSHSLYLCLSVAYSLCEQMQELVGVRVQQCTGYTLQHQPCSNTTLNYTDRGYRTFWGRGVVKLVPCGSF